MLATDTVGPTELIQHGETGWLVAKGDPSLLAKGILYCLINATLRQHLADRGYEKLSREFSPKVIVAAYADLYAQLIEKSRRSA